MVDGAAAEEEAEVVVHVQHGEAHVHLCEEGGHRGEDLPEYRQVPQVDHHHVVLVVVALAWEEGVNLGVPSWVDVVALVVVAFASAWPGEVHAGLAAGHMLREDPQLQCADREEVAVLAGSADEKAGGVAAAPAAEVAAEVLGQDEHDVGAEPHASVGNQGVPQHQAGLQEADP